MQQIITPDEAARLDRESPIPVSVLMERAGAAVALEAVRMGAGYGSRVIALAGVGNNGGDAYVAARYLRDRGVFVAVHSLGEPRTSEATAARDQAAARGVGIESLGSPVMADLVIDGFFGGGFQPGLPEAVTEWMRSGQRVLAIDIPSGVDPRDGTVDGEAFVAGRTVTFDYRKVGHVLGAGPDHCGIVTVAPIGLGAGRPALKLVEAVDAPLPSRQRQAHKWSAGSVLVVGGAKGMTGAATMAGKAALAFGAGAVGVAVPDEATATATAHAPELLHYSLDSLPDRYGSLIIGPGLGPDHDELARKLIESWEGSLVVDADALRLVTDRHKGNVVVTPHVGEFRRMAGVEPTAAAAADLARRLNGVVVLKGNPTIITDGEVPWVVDRGGPELATIGTGDVLAGMTGALLAAGLDPLAAARSATYWHGVAGSALAAKASVTAMGLISEIGRYR
ncbi:MAG: NAD(P)H-hydrate dehydratase [Actinobacteria bacterium]|nr:NAD(P)H-hydrate dehydratase [Actinomycetota bacterium]